MALRQRWSHQLKAWVIEFGFPEEADQKDHDEYREEMELGGPRYDPLDMGPQSSVRGRK